MRILALGDRDPAQLTHRALDATFALMPNDVQCEWTATDSHQARDLDQADVIWLLPGSPGTPPDAARDSEGFFYPSGTSAVTASQPGPVQAPVPCGNHSGTRPRPTTAHPGDEKIMPPAGNFRFRDRPRQPVPP